MKRFIEDLNRHLEYIESKKMSVDEYLAEFPNVSEFEPMLRMAAAMRKAGKELPVEADKAAGKKAFLEQVDAENHVRGLTIEGKNKYVGWFNGLNPLAWGRKGSGRQGSEVVVRGALLRREKHVPFLQLRGKGVETVFADNLRSGTCRPAPPSRNENRWVRDAET